MYPLDQAFAVELVGFARAGLWGLRHLACLRAINRILQTHRRFFSSWRSIKFVRVLPPSLRDLKCNKDNRLAWLLSQDTGTFCVVVVDNRGCGNHAVAIPANQLGRHVILDNEERVALPLGVACLPRCCWAQRSFEAADFQI